MTKSDLSQRIAEKLNIPSVKADLILTTVFEAMTNALKREERIEIRGFGTFEVRHYKGYEGRNPKSGETVQVEPKRLPFFKVGKELREKVNAGSFAGGSEPEELEQGLADEDDAGLDLAGDDQGPSGEPACLASLPAGEGPAGSGAGPG